MRMCLIYLKTGKEPHIAGVEYEKKRREQRGNKEQYCMFFGFYPGQDGKPLDWNSKDRTLVGCRRSSQIIDKSLKVRLLVLYFPAFPFFFSLKLNMCSFIKLDDHLYFVMDIHQRRMNMVTDLSNIRY